MSVGKSRLVKATALVPLAVLSAVWTVSVAGVGGPAAVTVADRQPAATLPDGTTVPSQAIEAPASVTGDQGSLSSGADAQQIVSTASTSGIPSVALAAYQRAETVINTADAGCHLPWQLVAAIGRVESNHGRAGGNTLDDKGIATPGIFGVALDGTASVALINDTDAGQYDNDTAFDRAVGPMQFIPSTWSVVGVDADGDGERNPQDVNDAALGTAVYLCSGDDDLASDAGRRAAVLRYNHSQSYVGLVLSVMDAYLTGDFTSVPNSTLAAGTLVPSGTGPRATSTDKNKTTKPTSKKTPKPTAAPTPTAPPPSSAPQDNPNEPKPTAPTSKAPKPTLPSVPPISLPPLPSTSIPPVDQILTLVQANAQCVLDMGLLSLPLPLVNPAFDKCVKDYMTP